MTCTIPRQTDIGDMQQPSLSCIYSALSDVELPASMAGFFKKLFGVSNSAPQPQPQSESYDEVAIFEECCRHLAIFLTPQLQMLGFELGKVPPTGTFISKRSRGYIWGIAATVLAPWPEEFKRAMVSEVMRSAFWFVYGDGSCEELMQLTLDESTARDPATLSGSYHAEDDVTAVYEAKPHASVMGFWILNNGIGNPDEKMPPILNPRPLPVS